METDKKAKNQILTLLYWKELFIYFWVFSLVGYYIEFIWVKISPSSWHPIVPTIIPLAAPYGLGVIAVILLVKPIVDKYRINPFITFVLCGLVCGMVEYISAAMVVLVTGKNQFWDYSSVPFNINGYVSLQSVVSFAVLSFMFLDFIYPFCERAMKKQQESQTNIIFWTMFLSYGVDLVFLAVK